jgi:hypothetical protein
MGYIDMAVGTAFFLFFLAMVLLITIQHFVRYTGVMTITEYRDEAIKLFNMFFGTKGIPSDWEETEIAPSELGLIDVVYVKPILVRETSNLNRQQEPVIVNVVFDHNCENTARNNTVRLYQSNLTVVSYEFVSPLMCSGDFLNETYIRFNVTVGQNEDRVFFLYYSNEENVPPANYSPVFNTSGWVDSTGDAWTESTTSWSRVGGVSNSPETNGTTKMRGDYSVQIKDYASSNNTIGLLYNPGSPITGVSNGWYIDAWIYLDDVTNVSAISVNVSETNETITTNISTGSLINNKWYHFERKLNNTYWEGWETFNATKGIDNVSFYMINNTPGIVRQIKLDELHFEIEPLYMKVFPTESRDIVSDKKLSALENLTYEDLRYIIGEDYRFRIEIV